MKNFIFLSIVSLALLFTTISCDVNKDSLNSVACDVAHKADLIVPNVINLYGQTHKNIIFHNLRTGEVFTQNTGSQFGVLIGDFVEVGTMVENKWNNSACEFGADAGESLASLIVTFVNAFDNISRTIEFDNPYTPPIDLGGYAMAFSGFIYNGERELDFKFIANDRRDVDEFDFLNNDIFNDNVEIRGLGSNLNASFSTESLKNPLKIEDIYPGEKIIRKDGGFSQISIGTNNNNYSKSKLVKMLSSGELKIEF